jgi:hypothetical protein
MSSRGLFRDARPFPPTQSVAGAEVLHARPRLCGRCFWLIAQEPLSVARPWCPIRNKRIPLCLICVSSLAPGGLQAEMSRMEAERLTLLAAHDSQSESESDDDFSSMHIELAAITAAAAAAAAAGSSSSRRPGSSSRGSARGLRATVESVRHTPLDNVHLLAT